MHKGSQGEWGFSHHYRFIQLPSGLTDAGADLAIIECTATTCLLGSARRFLTANSGPQPRRDMWNRGGILQGYSPKSVDRRTRLPGGRRHRPAPTEEQRIAACRGLTATLETYTVLRHCSVGTLHAIHPQW